MRNFDGQVDWKKWREIRINLSKGKDVLKEQKTFIVFSELVNGKRFKLQVNNETKRLEISVDMAKVELTIDEIGELIDNLRIAKIKIK